MTKTKKALTLGFISCLLLWVGNPAYTHEPYDAKDMADAMRKLEIKLTTDFEEYIPYQPIILTAYIHNPNPFDIRISESARKKSNVKGEMKVKWPWADEECDLPSHPWCWSPWMSKEGTNYIIKPGTHRNIRMNLMCDIVENVDRLKGEEKPVNAAKAQIGEYTLTFAKSKYPKEKGAANILEAAVTFIIAEPRRPIDIAALARYEEILKETNPWRKSLWHSRGPINIPETKNFALKMIDFYEKYKDTTYGVYVAHSIAMTYLDVLKIFDDNGKQIDSIKESERAIPYLLRCAHFPGEYPYRFEAMVELARRYRWTKEWDDAKHYIEEVKRLCEDETLVRKAKEVEGKIKWDIRKEEERARRAEGREEKPKKERDPAVLAKMAELTQQIDDLVKEVKIERTKPEPDLEKIERLEDEIEEVIERLRVLTEGPDND